jgi:two-component system response regulator
MKNQTILLVQDNRRDEVLSLRALRKVNPVNEVIVTRDGLEALDYLFGTGSFAERDMRIMPQLVLLDLKLPKVDGFQVLKKIREDESTKLLTVVIFTSSINDEDLIRSHNLRVNSYVRKPLDLEQLQQIGLYWLTFNEAPPTV